MDWIQTLSIMFTVVASAYYIHREIQIDIRSARDDIKAQGARTDRLYEMFVDLRKDLELIRKEGDQKFYDLLKSQQKQ